MTRLTPGGPPPGPTMETGADGTITVRPVRGGQARGRAISYAAPGAVLAAVLLLRQSAQGALITVAIAVPALGLGVLILMRYLKTNRIYLSRAALGHTSDLLGRVREVPRESIAAMVQVTTSFWYTSTSPLRYLLVVGHDGRCLMRINWMYYSTGDLRALAAAIGADYQAVPDITPKKLSAQIPGALPWIARHPLLFATVIVAVIVAAVIAGVVISGAGGST